MLSQLPDPSKFNEFANKAMIKSKNMKLHKTKEEVVNKEFKLEQDRTNLARICQMLIDELNEWEGRVRVSEAVIGDLKKSGLGGIEELIDVLTRNEQHKDRLMEELDKSSQLDEDIAHQDKEIDKLETFINSPNGLNQQKVDELVSEVAVQGKF